MTEAKCSLHGEPLIWESGGDDQVTVLGRFYCPKCSESLMRALDRDARAVSGEEPYEVLYSADGIIDDECEIKFTAHYNLDMLEAAYTEHEQRARVHEASSEDPPATHDA